MWLILAVGVISSSDFLSQDVLLPSLVRAVVVYEGQTIKAHEIIDEGDNWRFLNLQNNQWQTCPKHKCQVKKDERK